MKTLIRSLASVLCVLLFSGVLSGCLESTVALNFIESDANGRCWSKWYTVPASQSESTSIAREYIESKRIEPFEVSPTSC